MHVTTRYHPHISTEIPKTIIIKYNFKISCSALLNRQKKRFRILSFGVRVAGQLLCPIELGIENFTALGLTELDTSKPLLRIQNVFHIEVPLLNQIPFEL